MSLWVVVPRLLQQVGVWTCEFTRKQRRERHTLAKGDGSVQRCLVALGESLLPRRGKRFEGLGLVEGW